MSVIDANMTSAGPAGAIVELDAAGVYYRQLNERIRAAARGGAQRIVVRNVLGQRYLGTALGAPTTLELHGTPGNDLAMFMDGATVIVHGNGQDGVGNTMNGGEVVIHGSAGDLTAHSLRGGRIYIRDQAGYRVAIHMKEYHEPVPVVVVGGTVGDYAGEYMAGGTLIVLGLDRPADKGHNRPAESGLEGQAEKGVGMRANHGLTGRFLGTGMHGGAIYLRGPARTDSLGKEIGEVEMDDGDRKRLERHVQAFAKHFDLNAEEILKAKFTKLMATSTRPYGSLYVY